MKVCFVTSECTPYVKTGGLADVSGSLPKSLSRAGCQIKLVVPLYDSIHTFDHQLVFANELKNIQVRLGSHVTSFNTWYGQLPESNVDVYFIDQPYYYHRGSPYTNDADEDERFVLLQHAAMRILQCYHWRPDIIHCNDWQTGLMPALLTYPYAWDSLFDETATLLSIHNIGYQGRFSPFSMVKAGIPESEFYPTGPFELYGSFSFLKSGIALADTITTVSPTYAQEIQRPEYGEGLDGVLRSRSDDLFGVLNGIDVDEWNPADDRYLATSYDVSDLSGKVASKEALLQEMGLPFDRRRPVMGIVSRLAGQKGFDLLEAVLGDVLSNNDVQLVVLGSGEGRYEDFFRWATHAFPHQVGLRLGYDIRLSHLIEAGSDMFLMPSRYEPCGLNQMYSLRYGTLPIVRHTGGLADTVRDYHANPKKGNGFSFNDFTPHALRDAIQRAIDMYKDGRRWKMLMRRGMKEDFSWDISAEKYMKLYERSIAKHVGAETG